MAGAAPLKAQDKDPVLAKVNGVEIHQSDLAVAEEEAGQLPPMSPDPEAGLPHPVHSSDMLLLAKAAEDQKLADTPEFKRKLAFGTKKLLMEAVAANLGWQGGPDRRCDAPRSMTKPPSRWARSKRSTPATS